MAFRFCIFFFLVLATASAGAATVELRGELVRRGNEFRLLDREGFQWPLIPVSEIVAQDLLELQSGDGLEVTLDRPNEASPFVLTEIHFVRVCRVIGLWVAEDFSLIDIADFDDFLVYSQDVGVLRAPEEYTYVLAPEEGPGWSIFLTQPGRVLTGRLHFSGANLTVRVWEKSTVKFHFQLTPLYRASRLPDRCL